MRLFISTKHALTFSFMCGWASNRLGREASKQRKRSSADMTSGLGSDDSRVVRSETRTHEAAYRACTRRVDARCVSFSAECQWRWAAHSSMTPPPDRRSSSRTAPPLHDWNRSRLPTFQTCALRAATARVVQFHTEPANAMRGWMIDAGGQCGWVHVCM